MAETGTALRDVALDDKYDLAKDRVFITGTQAVVRLLLMQRERDRLAGLNTAGFVSGYRGSPIGGLDQNLSRAKKWLEPLEHRLPARPQRGTRRHRRLGHAAGRDARRGPATTASSACGTARAPASTAPATSSATPTWPAPRSMAACWR